MVFGRCAGGWLLGRQLLVAGVGCGVASGAVSLGLSRGLVWMSGVDGVLRDWSRAGSCWRLCWYWSSRAVCWFIVGGLGGAVEVSGTSGLLLVMVRSMVVLLGDVVLVSIVLVLSMVVSGLSFVSVAVGASVGVTMAGSSWSWGGSELAFASRWLAGAAVVVLCGGVCWVVWRQVQSSLMVQQWNEGGARVWIVQCWRRVCRRWLLSAVTSC